MNKVSHLESQPLAEGSFWIEETGVQFRVAGKAYVVPSDADRSDAGKTKAGEVVRALRAQGEEANVDWWIAEREKSWSEGISGHLRATFARPTPGTPLDRVERKPEEWTETIKPKGETVSAVQTLDEQAWLILWPGRATEGNRVCKGKLYPRRARARDGGDARAQGRAESTDGVDPKTGRRREWMGRPGGCAVSGDRSTRQGMKRLYGMSSCKQTWCQSFVIRCFHISSSQVLLRHHVI
jgi:hypothetical protein